LLLDDTPDQDSESDEEETFEERRGRVARRGVHAGDQDEVGRAERCAQGELDRRVIQREEHQQQQHEWKGANHAQPELDLERECDREASDGRDRVEESRDALPRQQHKRAGQHNQHHRGEDAERGPHLPERVEGKGQTDHHRDGCNWSADVGQSDGRQRGQREQHADHHRGHQCGRGGELGVAVQADETDYGQPNEGIDAAAESVRMQWRVHVLQLGPGGSAYVKGPAVKWGLI